MAERDPLIVRTEGTKRNIYDALSTSRKMLVIFLGAGVLVLIVGGSIGLATRLSNKDENTQAQNNEEFADESFRDTSYSKYGFYRHASVATDNRDCASVGIKILAEMHGSAVDAGIASAICSGLQTMDSSGIGGGSFMVIYERPRDGTAKQIITLNSRERAPFAATADMYKDGGSSKIGGLAIGVPGVIAGYHAAWQKFGRVPWEELFKPSIAMARHGIFINKHLAGKIKNGKADLFRDPGLREMLYKEDGSPLQEGDYAVNKRLAETLEKISKEGPSVFYNGSVAQDIVDEVKGFGGIITKEDLAAFYVEFSEPFTSTIESKNWRMYSSNAPSSGPILQFMIRLLEDFNLKPEDLEGDQAAVTYNRIIEAFKFGFAKRTWMGDPNYTDVRQLLKDLSSEDYIRYTKSRISDNMTHNIEYYGPDGEVVSDGGTSHIAVLAGDDAAFSMTTTINLSFGAKVMGTKTGIIYNNQMDDFSHPDIENRWGLQPTKENLIEGGKRPISSMSPTIITDDLGEVKMVIGGSGGAKIPTAVVYALSHNLWFGKPINEAVDALRLHHQLQPNLLVFEKGFPEKILQTLKKFGHKLELSDREASVQAIHNTCSSCKTTTCHRNCIIAVSDKRKGGVPDGY